MGPWNPRRGAGRGREGPSVWPPRQGLAGRGRHTPGASWFAAAASADASRVRCGLAGAVSPTSAGVIRAAWLSPSRTPSWGCRPHPVKAPSGGATTWAMGGCLVGECAWEPAACTPNRAAGPQSQRGDGDLAPGPRCWPGQRAAGWVGAGDSGDGKSSGRGWAALLWGKQEAVPTARPASAVLGAGGLGCPAASRARVCRNHTPSAVGPPGSDPALLLSRCGPGRRLTSSKPWLLPREMAQGLSADL